MYLIYLISYSTLVFTYLLKVFFTYHISIHVYQYILPNNWYPNIPMILSVIYWAIIFDIVSIKFHYICLEYALNRWMEEGYTKTLPNLVCTTMKYVLQRYFVRNLHGHFTNFCNLQQYYGKCFWFYYNLNRLDKGIWFLRLFDNAYILFSKNFIIQLYFTNSTSTTFFVCAKNRAANAFDSLG